MKKSMVLILTILSLSGCLSDSEKLKTVTIEDRYSVSMPSDLTEENMNDEASLQYLNKWRGLYVMVIDESQSDFAEGLKENGLTESYTDDLKGYSEWLLSRFGDGIAASRKSELLDTLINNMPAKVVSFKKKSGDLDVFYSLGFIEGKNQYYQIVTWTDAEREERNKDVMNQIIYSFKEL